MRKKLKLRETSFNKVNEKSDWKVKNSETGFTERLSVRRGGFFVQGIRKESFNSALSSLKRRATAIGADILVKVER